MTGCTPSVGTDQACTDLAKADCTKLDDCVFNGTAVRYGGTGTCRGRQRQLCLIRLGATGSGNTASDVELCASEVPSSTCTGFDQGDILDCQAKIGAGANGAPCAFSGQCESGNCAVATGTNCGMCAPASSAGDSCAAASCSHGFVCVAATQQCQPIGNANDACDTDHPCGAGLTCVVAAEAAAGTCRVSGDVLGASCDPKHQTASGCNTSLGFFCSGATDTCAPITYVTAGSSCGSAGGQFNACTDASTCFAAQCVANAGDGAACDTVNGPACLPPARCVTGSATTTAGTCQIPDPTRCS